VLVMAEAEVRLDQQVSLVGSSGSWRRLDQPSREVQAQFKTKGNSPWPELEFSVESDADFASRIGPSARRTEIVTATYFIRRPQK
jgi:hypothetical protein